MFRVGDDFWEIIGDFFAASGSGVFNPKAAVVVLPVVENGSLPDRWTRGFDSAEPVGKEVPLASVVCHSRLLPLAGGAGGDLLLELWALR